MVSFFSMMSFICFPAIPSAVVKTEILYESFSFIKLYSILPSARFVPTHTSPFFVLYKARQVLPGKFAPSGITAIGLLLCIATSESVASPTHKRLSVLLYASVLTLVLKIG